MTPYESWGRYPKVTHRAMLEPWWPDELGRIASLDGTLLPFGRGRSYGDVCLNDDGTLISTARLGILRGFDEATGTLRCEAGATLSNILDFIVPRGWFLPVVPGTKEVSVGGAIANDVHGKNHHRAGTFGRWIHSLELLRSDGEVRTCSIDANADLFRATVGGMGLTGLIVSATLQLTRIPGPMIDRQTIRFGSLDEFFAISRESDATHEFTVAWVDCIARGADLGRGIFYRGNTSERPGPASSRGRLPAVPLDAPGWLLAPPLMKAFNQAYYHKSLKPQTRGDVHFDPFFFPLDRVPSWNRLYGRSGFLQHQCVVPFSGGDSSIREILDRIARSGMASFLAVLKTFGDVESPGLMSFPRPGVTLALDFPFRGRKTLDLLSELDGVVRAAGGALYPAKDARMSAETFRESYPRLAEFRKSIDPKFSSSLWRRVNA